MNKKAKVLLLAPVGASQGGIANWTKLLLNNSTGEKVEYKPIDTSVHHRVLGGRPGFWGRICDLRNSLFRGMRLLADLIIDRPDIVYFTCSPSIGFALRDAPQVLLSRLLGLKVIIHLRGGSLNGFWGGGCLRRCLAAMAGKQANYIFVITRDCEKIARQKYGNNKVVYIPNFIDVNSAAPADNKIPKEIDKNKFNIIHVAFQCREKGTFEIIEAARSLPDKVNILLIGVVSADNRVGIEGAIDKGGVKNKVRLLGAKYKPELWDYYKYADLFLFPTYSEGFPNVIMEAMLYGLPILATNVGNIADMTDASGEKPAAILLEKAGIPDSAEIADKVNALIENNHLRKILSENGIKRVRECYSLDVVIPQFETLLQVISSGKNALAESKRYFQQNENVI